MSAETINTETDPNFAGMLCIAALFAWAGILLAFLFLLSFPPKRYTAIKDRDAFIEQKAGAGIKPGELYYFEGPVARGREWQPKLEMFLNGTNATVEVTAGELNAGIASMFRQPSRPPGEKTPNISILPKTPNLFVDEKEGIFLSLPTEISMFGSHHKVEVFARGHFTTGAAVTLKIDTQYLNNAAIPAFGGLADRIVGTLLKAYSESDEFKAFRQAWAQLESAEVVADKIRLKLR